MKLQLAGIFILPFNLTCQVFRVFAFSTDEMFKVFILILTETTSIVK